MMCGLRVSRLSVVALTLTCLTAVLGAQQVVGPDAEAGNNLQPWLNETISHTPGTPGDAETKGQPAVADDPSYLLGPGDQITVFGVGYAAEISEKPVRIDGSGYLNLPLVGRVRAKGLTLAQLEEELVERLKTYIQEPKIALAITDFRSQPVSVFGSVKQPGVHHLQGRHNLIEVLSLAGGLLDTAGDTVRITRRTEWGRIPLDTAKDDPSGQFSIAEVDLSTITSGESPENNIALRPHDVVSVPRANLVYIVGSVARSGGFVLKDQSSMSVLEAISLAGGLLSSAAAKKAKILRNKPGTSQRVDVAVNLKQILDGKSADDVLLYPDDILFVPDSSRKRATEKTVDTAIRFGSIAIWRF